MGILDSLVDPFFKKDEEGRTLYFPWGNSGSAIVIDSDETERKIRKFLKLTFLAIFVAFIVFVNLFEGWWALTIIPVYLVWFYVGIRILTKDLPRSPEKLYVSEMRLKQAQTIGWFWIGLWALTIIFMFWGAIWHFTEGTQSYWGIFLLAASIFLLVFLFRLARLKLQLSKNAKN
ncbi:MAG: hypothetical protein WDZ54_10100 [Sneathiella sp.]